MVVCLSTSHIIGGSCYKYHFCRDKNYVCRDKYYVCRDKYLLSQRFYGDKKYFVATNIKNSRQNLRQAYFCRDKRRVFVATSTCLNERVSGLTAEDHRQNN